MVSEVAVATPKDDKINGRSRWEVESDLRALRDASKIRNCPTRSKAVKILAKEEMGALEKIASDEKNTIGAV
jgi:hypothetical protein